MTKIGLLERVLAGVLHEINTPLGVLTTNSKLLQHALSQSRQVLSKTPAPVRADVVNVLGILESIQASQEEACSRLTNTMESLKTCIGLDEAEWKRVDISGLLDCGIKLLQNSSGKKVEIERGYERGHEIDGAIHQLSQLFMHLLLKAMEASGDGGRVTVSVEESDEDVIVSFESTSTGTQGRLRGTDTDGPGLGSRREAARAAWTDLDLATYDDIVKRHQAQIERVTTPAGTSLHITLPKQGASQRT